jgi:hypothetical protein
MQLLHIIAAAQLIGLSMKIGISGTPAYVIDGKLYLGQIPPEILDKVTKG